MKPISPLKKKLPTSAVISTVVLAVSSATFLEARELDKMDHPKPYKVGCIQCHSDRKTLLAIAEKAGDPMYLVKSGDLTAVQLKELLKPSNEAKPKGKGHDSGKYPTK